MNLKLITLYDNHYMSVGDVLEYCGNTYLILDRNVSSTLYCKIFYTTTPFKVSKYNWINDFNISILKFRYIFD
jgi:hypothetical protein